MVRRPTFFAFLLALLLGCATAPPRSGFPPGASPPSWYLSPPDGGATLLVGAGEGDDLEGARLAALDQVACTLGVTVSSTFSTLEEAASVGGRETYSKEVAHRVVGETGRVKLNNHKVLKGEWVGRRAYVLVGVDKMLMASEEQAELHRLDREITDACARARTGSVADKIRQLEPVEQKREQAKVLLSTLLSLGGAEEPQQYLDRYGLCVSTLRRALSEVVITLDLDEGSEPLASHLREALSRNGYRLAEECGADVESCLHVSARTARVRSEASGVTIVKLQTAFTVTTADGLAVGGSAVETLGHSVSGEEQALLSAGRAFGAQAKSPGILQVLGLQ